jgi:PGF-CTERM protein/uncharacterized repeat protein (TIGR01451 family)
MNTKIVAFGLVIALVLSVSIASALSNSGGGDWGYYREITIKENSGKTLSDYQVLVELSPSNFPDKAKMDGSDLRFAEDGKELSYWIEDYDAEAKTAKIFVKVPNISASGEAKIKMYYGNEKASGVSDGDKVFEFFDDFDENALKNCWDVKTAQYDLGDSKIRITITGDYGGLYGKLPNEYFSGGLTVGFKWCKCSSGWTPAFHPTDNPMYIEWGKWGHDDDNWVSYDGGGWNNVHVKRVDTNQYSVVHYIVDISKKLFKVEIDETSSDSVNCANGKDTSNFKKIDGLVFREGGFSRGTLGIDFVFVAKYTSPEPTITLSQEFPTKKAPSLTLTKSASPSTIQEGETTTISIRVENTGTGDAKSVEVTDTIPPGFKIISGSKSESFGEIKSGDYRTFEYTLKVTGSGKFTCDPGTATYKDADGNSYSTASNSVSIQVGGEAPVGADSDGDGWSDEKEREMGTNPYSVDSDGDGLKDPEDPNPTVPEEKKTPGFEAVFAIAGLLAVAYLLRRKNERQKI